MANQSFDYEDFLNTYTELWNQYGCPMNGVNRAQVRLLFKQGQFEDALAIIDKHHERMVKAGRMPRLKKVSVDVRLPQRGNFEDPVFRVSEEWHDESEACEHWNCENQERDWNEYAGDGFARKSKLKNGW